MTTPLGFVERFICADGTYHPLFTNTFIDTGMQVVTSNGKKWVQQTYQFQPSADSFQVGDSVTYQGEMRTLYSVTPTTATISVENARDPMMDVPLSEISPADWNPPDTYLVSDLKLFVRIYKFMLAVVASGSYLQYPEMSENTIYELYANRSASAPIRVMLYAPEYSFEQAERLLDEWADHLNTNSRTIMRWGIIRRMETIDAVCSQNFTQTFDSFALVYFMQEQAVSLGVTEFTRHLIEPQYVRDLVQVVDLDKLDPYLLLVLDKMRELTKRDLTPEVHSYLWKQPPFHPQLIIRAGLAQMGEWDVLEQPFLMYRFPDGVKLAEDLFPLLVNIHNLPRFKVGDLVRYRGSTGTVTSIDSDTILDQYEVTYLHTWQTNVGFDLVHASVLNPDGPLILTQPDRYEPEDFVVDPFLCYQDSGVGDVLQPIWYYDTVGGRVHIFVGVERSYMKMQTMPNMIHHCYEPEVYAAKDEVKDKKISTPLLALGTVGLVGAILLVDGV